MENVAALVGKKFVKTFNEWQLTLSRLGYTNHAKVLDAKDFGVPQHRERIFLLSRLDNRQYYFPRAFKLERRLKDVLEQNVDEKYYLSDETVKAFMAHTERKDVSSGLNPSMGGALRIAPRPEMDNEEPTTTSMKVQLVGKVNSSQDGVVVSVDGVAPTHTAGHGNCPKILEDYEQERHCRCRTSLQE